MEVNVEFIDLEVLKYRQGVKQAKRDAAIGFYKKGLPISDIAEVLHLSIEQIEEILSSDSDDSVENTKN